MSRKKSAKDHLPPAWLDSLLESYCSNILLEGIKGDLDELYHRRVKNKGSLAAKLGYIFGVLGFFRYQILKQNPNKNKDYIMGNYFKIGLRNILKRKTFAAVNIMGLAISMSVCLLIISLIVELKSYDQFHPDKDRIYRVISDQYWKGDLYSSTAVVPLALGSQMKSNLSNIEEVSLIRRNLKTEIKFGEKIKSVKGLFADANFFGFFGFELIEGNPETCLKEPFSVVITEEVKQTLFGKDQAVGKEVSFDGGLKVTVTGVVKKTKSKSHIRFDILASISTLIPLANQGVMRNEMENWTSLNDGLVYFKTPNINNLDDIQTYINKLGGEKYKDSGYEGTSFRLQSITDIYLGEELSNQISPTVPQELVFYLALIAMVVVFLAVFNYTNLTISQSLSRAKEIGIRKTSGASKGQIYWQLIMESVVISLAALIIAVGLYRLLVPFFYQLVTLDFITINIETNYITYLYFILFAIIIGVIAGAVPAMVYSSITPIRSLRSAKTTNPNSRWSWRNFLVGTQLFFCSIFLVTATLMDKQISFMLSSNYGFQKENIINIPLKDVQFPAFRNELLKQSFVMDVSASGSVPGLTDGDSFGVMREGSNEMVVINFLMVNGNFIDNLGLKLLYGKSFKDNPLQTTENSVILSVKAAKMLGWDNPNQAIGQLLDNGDGQLLEIIGVIKDFNYRNLFFPVKGLALRYIPNYLYVANVKVKPENTSETIASLESIWRKLDPNHTFDYKFYDQQIMYSYGSIIDLSRIFKFFSVLTIIIACLGLLGMTIFWTTGKLREIGIRKVMGAGDFQILKLLSQNLIVLILLSFIVAVPVSWWLNSLWLNLIAVKIDIGPMVFLVTLATIALVTIITTSIPTWNALKVNPTQVIKDN